MAIPQLDDEQIRTWTLEQKDRWWLANVWRGDMPQLTVRSGITGFLLGGFLSATNLYVGAKTGWTLGVGLTSVILAFVAFRVLASLRLAKDFTILENNAMQSIATAAGYMTGPLVASMSAYMLVTNKLIPWYQIVGWSVILALIGVLVAFPMKRRFINDEQQPFPEGRACGVVLDALYTSEAAVGVFKAKALLFASIFGGVMTFIMGEGYQTWLQVKLLGLESVIFLRERVTDYFYLWFATGADGQIDPTAIPRIGGIDARELGLGFSLNMSMFGAGGLMGTRVANSLLIGCVLNFVILAPWMINVGDISPKTVLATGEVVLNKLNEPVFGRNQILNTWSLWWGISAMVVASLTALFAKPKVIISAFTGLFSKRDESKVDVLKHIELPVWLSFVGVPVLTGVAVFLGHQWFGLVWWHGLLAIPLIIVLSLIAANATGLTSTTPTGALSKITQFTFGAIDRTNPATNLMTAGMTSEIASNASNLLMDIKPGYMLGAKPRQQAIGHVIGVVSGAIAATPLFYFLFFWKYKAGDDIAPYLSTEQYPFPGASIWKGVSDLIQSGGSNLAHSAVIAMVIAGLLSMILEIARIKSKGKLPIVPLAIGLGVVIPPDSTFMMWAGAMFFALMGRVYSAPGTRGNLLWVGTHEPICAGLIAGTAIIGIGDTLVTTFLL